MIRHRVARAAAEHEKSLDAGRPRGLEHPYRQHEIGRHRRHRIGRGHTGRRHRARRVHHVVDPLAHAEAIVGLSQIRANLLDAPVANDHRPMMNRDANHGSGVEQCLDEVRADKAGPAGHEDALPASAAFRCRPTVNHAAQLRKKKLLGASTTAVPSTSFVE